MEERLQKIIARAGLGSRRGAEQMILQGRVRVDGKVVTELGAKADPERNEIRVDDTRVRPGRPRRYFVLNKPSGYVTTRSDPGSRLTVLDLLPSSLRFLFPVGRLDMGTSGLLLLTDDGDFAQRVAHPRYGVPRTYLATVRGEPDEPTLERARAGIRIEGRRLRVKSVERLTVRPTAQRRSPRSRGADATLPKARLRLVMVEGKNREIRRLFGALGHHVLDLHRSGIGRLSDRGLPVGCYRPLTPDEVRGLSGVAGRPGPGKVAEAPNRRIGRKRSEPSR